MLTSVYQFDGCARRCILFITVDRTIAVLLTTANVFCSYVIPWFPSTVLHDGDISYADVYAIAKEMRGRSMARKMAGTVMEILGTAQSVGCTVDGTVYHRGVYDLSIHT